MRIEYNFAGQNFSSFGVSVSKSEGLLGKPKRKKPEAYEYPGESGKIVDLSEILYEPRTLKLSCFVISHTLDSLIETYEDFTSLLYDQTDIQDLILKIDNQAKLTFSVYVDEISSLEKKFRDGNNVGKFTVTFIEPKPQ